ncbi:hypothetical protein OG592_39480 [Streptomyces avidinii]|uniref:hypothetical protein n=1 Tax=Streptomyces avidinii TaxID=1895 RepID=UPI00386EE3C6|nr:hypothetical protein OG592_39480 [Streptomyces avidinii]
MATAERREIVVGPDPVGKWHLPLARAADEAHRRRLGLRPLVAVPPPHDGEVERSLADRGASAGAGAAAPGYRENGRRGAPGRRWRYAWAGMTAPPLGRRLRA